VPQGRTVTITSLKCGPNRMMDGRRGTSRRITRLGRCDNRLSTEFPDPGHQGPGVVDTEASDQGLLLLPGRGMRPAQDSLFDGPGPPPPSSCDSLNHFNRLTFRRVEPGQCGSCSSPSSGRAIQRSVDPEPEGAGESPRPAAVPHCQGNRAHRPGLVGGYSFPPRQREV